MIEDKVQEAIVSMNYLYKFMINYDTLIIIEGLQTLSFTSVKLIISRP